jgi:hypothetical protein
MVPPVDERDAALLSAARARLAGASLRKTCAGAATLDDLELGTALIYEALLKERQNAAFQDALRFAAEQKLSHDILFGIVPGAFYRNHNNTGADGSRMIAILRSLNFRVETVPIRSFGRVYENARIINDWLAQQNDRVALITLSKGSADSKAAFQLAGPHSAAWRRVHAWIGLSGLTEGTALIEWLRRQPLRMVGVRLLLALRGQSFSAADDLCRSDDNVLLQWPELPPQLQLVHVVGFPTRRHLQHPWAFRGYDRLAALGPNDGGGILLADTARLPGVVCPLWGTDHYLNPAWDSTALLRRIVLTAIRGERHASSRANEPTAAPANKSSA